MLRFGACWVVSRFIAVHVVRVAIVTSSIRWAATVNDDHLDVVNSSSTVSVVHLWLLLRSVESMSDMQVSCTSWLATETCQFVRANSRIMSFCPYVTKEPFYGSPCSCMSGSTHNTALWWWCWRYEYHWCDGVTFKKPTKLPAPQYIELLMDWVETQINNEDLFPVKVGQFLHCSLHL